MRTTKCDRCGGDIALGGMRLLRLAAVTAGPTVEGAYALDQASELKAELCEPCRVAVLDGATTARRAAEGA